MNIPNFKNFNLQILFELDNIGDNSPPMTKICVTLDYGELNDIYLKLIFICLLALIKSRLTKRYNAMFA